MSPAATASLAASPPDAAARVSEGYVFGLLGVLIFAFTLPMSRVAVSELDPVLVGLGRAVIAALPAALALLFTRSRLPTRAEWSPLLRSALGVVVAWPMASTLAMQSVPSAHGAVVNGLLPLSTAAFAVWLGGERHSRAFWFWAAAGALLVVGFALREGQGTLQAGDLWLLLAVVLGGMGYAEGARAARTLGGWRTICWALVVSAPFLIVPVMTLAARVPQWPSAPVVQAVIYLALGSMFTGFFFWYRGLAAGGIARVGQVQLVQPFLTVMAAALMFGESVPPATYGFALAVILVIAAGRRAVRAR